MKRIYFICCCVAVALATILIFLLPHSKPHATGEAVMTNAPNEPGLPSQPEGQKSNVNQTDQTPIPPDIQRAVDEQNRKLADKMGITPGMTPEQVRQNTFEWLRTQMAKSPPEQKPVQFYGKVVDEQMQPISGASIHFIWSDASKTNGTSEADAVSGNDGSFSLIRGTGSRGNIYVTKKGYYEVKALNGFDFDVTGNGSSPENPVVFHFRKKGSGADLITSQYGVNDYVGVSAPRDGSPVRVDFFNRRVDPGGQLEISQRKPAPEQYRNAAELEANSREWSYRLAIPDGGLVETTDVFTFEAPESGYQPSVEFAFQKGTTNWTEHLNKTFYIEFGNPRRYGRIHVETSMTTGTVLDYAINPSGSRYLEPK